jgi:hypothetical protein
VCRRRESRWRLHFLLPAGSYNPQQDRKDGGGRRAGTRRVKPPMIIGITSELGHERTFRPASPPKVERVRAVRSRGSCSCSRRSAEAIGDDRLRGRPAVLSQAADRRSWRYRGAPQDPTRPARASGSHRSRLSFQGPRHGLPLRMRSKGGVGAVIHIVQQFAASGCDTPSRVETSGATGAAGTGHATRDPDRPQGADLAP